jgi:hypothetical protein
MKIQTNAQIDSLTIDGVSWELKQAQKIEFEFSAIDTGGGFKDPILDFSFIVEKLNTADLDEDKHDISLILSDPDKEDNEAHFSYQGVLKVKDDNLIEVNGRLKGNQLSRELIGFVLKRLR